LQILLFVALASCAGSAAAELQDPTRPSYVTDDTVAGAVHGALRVNAIFISGERRIAIVNGQRLRIGETVNGATVNRIEQDRVSFVRGDEVFAVPLISGSSRK
jgi:MSHA biogenesis protein MshK